MPCRRVSVVGFASMLLFSSAAAHAEYQLGADDGAHLRIGGLLQVQNSTTQDASPNGESWDTEFYVRRARLSLTGQIDPLLNFHLQTDSPNYGRNGQRTSMQMVDAVAELNVAPALQADFGIVLPPFSHHGYQSSRTLLTVDTHPDVINVAANRDLALRDFGMVLRGMPFGPWFEYRLAALNGVRGTRAAYDPVTEEWIGDGQNPDDRPRIVARIVGNAFEPEGGPGAGGMYTDGIYIERDGDRIVSSKKVLSFGLSADLQPDLVVRLNQAGDAIASREAYTAFAADVFWDLPLDAARLLSVTGQVNGYYYDYGARNAPGRLLSDVQRDPLSNSSEGITGFALAAEAGFRYDNIQPLAILDVYQPTTNRENDHTGAVVRIAGGLNQWVYAHTFNAKVQFGATRRGLGTSKGEWVPSLVAQAQLAF